MKKIIATAPHLLITIACLAITLSFFAANTRPNVALAAISGYSASGFSQFCAANPEICTKANLSGRTGTVSCPNESQTIQTVYVHAGDAQTVYELPEEGFDYTIDGSSVTVNVTTHQNNLSWIGVVCSGDPAATPTPTGAIILEDPTPTPTTDPGEPTPTPTVAAGETPFPQPQNDPFKGVGGNQNNSSSSTSNTQGQVLGATTMASTGVATDSLVNLVGLAGATLSVLSFKKRK